MIILLVLGENKGALRRIMSRGSIKFLKIELRGEIKNFEETQQMNSPTFHGRS